MIKLSILVPSITERSRQLELLLEELERQIGELPVEVLVFTDNCKRSLGDKKNDLKNLVKGDYWAMCDDDDMIGEDYISSILEAIKSNPDIITFKQLAHINGEPFLVTFGKDFKDEEARKENNKWVDVKRKPYHVCVWKTSVVKNCFFPSKNYFDDSEFAEMAQKELLSEVHIDKILHYYYFSSEKTRSGK